MSKYDFRDLILNEDFMEIEIYMESMRNEEDLWGWYNEVISDLELDEYDSSDEYELNESMRNWIYLYIFD